MSLRKTETSSGSSASSLSPSPSHFLPSISLSGEVTLQIIALGEAAFAGTPQGQAPGLQGGAGLAGAPLPKAGLMGWMVGF